MKKVLSAIIAIIMIVSCMPVAFAYEFTGLEGELFDLCCRYYSSAFSVYTKDGVTGEMGGYIPGSSFEDYERLRFDDFLTEIVNAGGIKKLVAEKPEKAAEILEGMKDIQRTVETLEADSEYEKVIDLYGVCAIRNVLFEFYYAEESNFVVDFIENECDTKKRSEYAYLLSSEGDIVFNRALSDPGSVTQADFDAAAKPWVDFCFSAIGCYEGVHIPGEFTDLGDGTHKADCTFCKSGEVIEAHTYGEYTPNGDATTEADGTKTAKCDKCDATDTVADEGSKLVEDIAESNFFNDIIEKIMSFFENIINFFKNLIG